MTNQYSFSRPGTLPAKRNSSPALAIDTGSPVVSVAVSIEGEVRAHRSSRDRNASGSVLALVSAVLTEAELDLHDLNLLLGLRGPGRFTGLRVGLATLQGMRMALEIPSATWDTFEVLATLSPNDDRKTIACVDALQGNWITQKFNLGPSKRAAEEPILLSSSEIQAMEHVHLVGYAISALRTSEAPLDSCTLIEPGPLAPQALELLATRQPNFDTKALSRPLYLRPPAASLPQTPER